jgi:peptidylprolyl isomerase
MVRAMKIHTSSFVLGVAALALTLAAGCGAKDSAPQAPKKISPAPATANAATATRPPTAGTAATTAAAPATATPQPASVGATPPPTPAGSTLPTVTTTLTPGAAGDPFAPPADVAAPPADASKTASGLAFKLLTPPTGKDKPVEWDTVSVHYTGWTTDGKMFDSSIKRGRPAEFPLKRVIPGWTEGLQLIAIGEKARLWIPVELAYQGRPGAPAGMLVFDVELLGITKGVAPPAAPPDVAAPPADATKTATGLAYKILTPGAGPAKPTAENTVEVHYTGWTTDGKMFDSSVQRGQPAVFPLNRVIPGWTEGLQLLKVGDKARLWIPEELAYKGRPGAPAGMLVFDVELLGIK